MWSDGGVDGDREDERLVRLARVVTHGMRNPLAIATGMLDLLDRQVADQLDDAQLDLLRRSSAALRRTADQLLQLQRYTAAHREPLAMGDVEVAAVVGDALASLGDAAPPVEDVGGAPVVRGDRLAVERVLRELLDNAGRHALAAGGSRVRVTVEDAGDVWHLVVSDDGPGVAPEHREAALEEGERLGRTGDGFGLGLPIARISARRQGGELHLEAEPGGGLRAVVRLPKAPLLVEEPTQR